MSQVKCSHQMALTPNIHSLLYVGKKKCSQACKLNEVYICLYIVRLHTYEGHWKICWLAFSTEISRNVNFQLTFFYYIRLMYALWLLSFAFLFSFLSHKKITTIYTKGNHQNTGQRRIIEKFSNNNQQQN